VSRNGAWLLDLLANRDVHAGSVQVLVAEMEKAVNLLMSARVLGGPSVALRLEVHIHIYIYI
jgi:hypothetical protein